MLLSGCAAQGDGVSSPMALVPLPLAALEGTWWEVASVPGPFQRGCINTRATYDLRADGTVGVLNRCDRDGRAVAIAGTAEAVAPGRLAVRLAGTPFTGRLWVLGRSEDGATLFLGTPSRRAAWVLSRDRVLSGAEAKEARMVFVSNGYDADRLVPTVQQ